MSAERPLTDAQVWVQAVCDITGWNVKLNAGRAAKLAKRLRLAGATIGDLERHYGQNDPCDGWWWYSSDWRGQKGQRPSQAGIQETWGAWQLPIAVQEPRSAVAQMLAHINQQESVNNGNRA